MATIRLPWYSSMAAEDRLLFAYGAITLFGVPFQALLLRNDFVTSWQPRKAPGYQLTTPTLHRLADH